jgi:hypothetical protein
MTHGLVICPQRISQIGGVATSEKAARASGNTAYINENRSSQSGRAALLTLRIVPCLIKTPPEPEKSGDLAI